MWIELIRFPASLSRLMANIGWPLPGKRRLLMLSMQSVLLYSVEVWAVSTLAQKYCTRMTSGQQQGSLRSRVLIEPVSYTHLDVYKRQVSHYSVNYIY